MIIYKLENQELLKTDISSIILDDENYYWILAEPQDINELSRTFNLKKDTVNADHETKIEVYSRYNFCIFNQINFINDKLNINVMNIYYSRNYIISISENSPILLKLANILSDKDNSLLINAKNPCNKILYLILDQLFIEYFDAIIEFEKKVEIFEEHVLKNRFKSFVSQFIDIRRQVLRLVRYVSPFAYLIDIVKLNENNVIDKDMIRYFENLDIKFDKLSNNIVSLKESVAYLREAYEAEVSNQANNIMKTFTIVSAIFLPLTLLTGIFGMNFEYMPWLNRQYGFYELGIGMIFLTVLLMIGFKLKKWM